jgi:hypothetical protein
MTAQTQWDSTHDPSVRAGKTVHTVNCAATLIGISDIDTPYKMFYTYIQVCVYVCVYKMVIRQFLPLAQSFQTFHASLVAGFKQPASS